MIRVARALVRQRQAIAALSGAGIGGPGITFRANFDNDIQMTTLPRSVISVRLDPTETNAVNSLRVEEVVTANDDGTDSSLQMAERIVAAINHKAFYDPDVAIHRAVCAGYSTEAGPGTRNEVTIEWIVTASWRPL